MSESKEAWLIAENERLTKENEQLVRDMHRIDSARQSAISQCCTGRTNDELESVVCGGAIGERGDACMSVDGVICETQFSNVSYLANILINLRDNAKSAMKAWGVIALDVELGLINDETDSC